MAIEAKFGHHLTEGQLSKYWKILDRRLSLENADCVVLGLTENAGKGRKGRQVKNWRLVTWRNLWLGFEKFRPAEDDPELSKFLHTLWRRIGGLKPERQHGKI